MTRYVDVVFSGQPPGVVEFLEVEDDQGRSIRFGEWVDRGDGTWALRIPLAFKVQDPRI